MKNISVLGIDLAKDVFQLHGINEHGKKILGKKVTRSALPKLIAQLPSCKIVMEACGGANYWSRVSLCLLGMKYPKLAHSM